MAKFIIMESKPEVTQRSCSAVQSRAAGMNSKNSVTGSLTNIISLQQSVTTTNFLHDVLSKTFYHEKSRPFTNDYICHNTTKKVMFFENEDNICVYPCCESLDKDLSSYVFQGLQNTLQNLKLELAKEKNISQILKRNILIAMKVVKMEVGANKEDFATLLERDKSGCWKGRQKMILALKRKLRYINEKIHCLENETENTCCKKKSKHKVEVMTEIPDDRQINWCLELERKEVWQNAERYRQNFIVSKELMKSSLERLTEKINKLEEEARVFRKKLSVTATHTGEELIQSLLVTKNQLKFKIEEKYDVTRKINILDHEISRNSLIKEELEKTVATQKHILKGKEEEVKLLKGAKGKIQTMSENVRKERNEDIAIRKKIFEEADRKYQQIVEKSESLLRQLTDSKHRLERWNKMQLEKSSVSLIKKSLSDYPTKITKEQLDFHRGVGDSVLSIEIPGNQTDLYKKKLLLYQSIFRVLCGRNEDKMKNAVNIIKETKEWTFDMVENRCLMLQLAFDIKTLTNQNKKLKKSVTHSSRRQNIKKKNSSQLMLEILNERKTYLAVKKKENEILKSLITSVLSSKEDDFSLLQSYLLKNNDGFLKQLTRMKFLNLTGK